MTYNHNDILSGTPYFDDFDDTKKFLRILFKPGYAVQARELTQLQTLLQSQISKFGDHVFTDGSIVFGGSVSLNRVNYLRVTGNYQESRLRSVVGKTLINADRSVVARCVEVLSSTTSDPYPVLFLQYLSAKQFSTTDTISVDNYGLLSVLWESTIVVSPISPSASNTAILASVDSGIFYVDGFFVTNTRQSIPLYTGSSPRQFTSTDASIGFNILRNVVTSTGDFTLKDPASGSYNYNAPGADRYVINLTLTSYAKTPADPNYIELARVVDSKLTYSKSSPSYSEILDLFARRTYDESGNYTVKPFGIELKEYLKRDKISLVVTLNSNGTPTNFAYPASTTAIGEITNTTKFPAQVGDILIRNNTALTEYVITSSKLLSGTLNSLQLQIVPRDSFITSTTYTDLPTTGTTFILKRSGTSTTESGITYAVNNNYKVKIISDVTGSVSIADADGGTADSNMFTATITPGKAYIYGYEFETTTPVNVFADKPRMSLTVENETIDSSLGNYLIVTSSAGKFSDNGYDVTFDLNDFPDVNLQKQIASFLVPVPSTEYSEFNVKYWTPSSRKSTNQFVSSEGGKQYNAYNWNQDSAYAEADDYYPHIIFLQQESGLTNKVLRKEILELELTNDANDPVYGFIEKRDINFTDDLYWSLLPNSTTENTPQYLGQEPINILDSSYETETSISRLVFNQSWDGDFITAYDVGFEGYDITKKYSREYNDDAKSFVYQVDYINLGNVTTDSEGNVTENNLRQSIRVKKAYTRRWVPGSSNDSLSLADNTLYIKIPNSNVVFGPSLNETRGFSLPNSINNTVEYGVIFNPTLGYEASYGSSIQAVSSEPNVVKITLQGPIDTNTTCNQTLTSIENGTTRRNFGSFKEGEEVIQVYYKNQVGYTATGIVKKVITNGNSYEVFVKVTGNEAPSDFIPQSFEGIVGTGEEYVYEGVSALLQGTDIQNGGPICACYTILGVSSFAEGNPTCGIFTDITFNDGYRQGQDFEVGEQVYQFDIDYIPLDNAQPPLNYDAQKVLALGTVMSWNTQTCTLSILVTKNEFKRKSGWIFGRNSRVRYGGRGWNLNQHNISTQTYGSEQVKEIERATGIFVDLDATKDINFIDEFNTTEDQSIKRIAYQVKTYETQNTESLSSGNWQADQEYSVTNADGTSGTFTATGNIISYTKPSPTTGPGYLLMEPVEGLNNKFAIRNGIANLLVVPGAGIDPDSGQALDVSISLLTAQKIVPSNSFYSEPQTESIIQSFTGTSSALNYTTVATAKAKQLKYIDDTTYHLYLTEIKPNVISPGGVYYSLDNLARVTRTKILSGGSRTEQELFLIGDSRTSPTVSSQTIQEPKNNSLLYEYPIGDKITSITNLTYEIQVDLKATGSSNGLISGVSFDTSMTGNVKFKGEKQVGSYYTVDSSILREYILIGPNSTIYNLTNTATYVTRIVNGGKTIRIEMTGSQFNTGTFTLICPMLVEGQPSNNIRTKTKTRKFEIAVFNDITGLMTLSKSDVISIESCINLTTSSPTEIPLSVLQLNGNQMNNVYELSTISATEKWRDALIKKGTVTTYEPNGIKCLVSYTYYNHQGTGPIIASSYINQTDGYDSIPDFIDPLTNKKISLDSVVDFRPFQTKDSTGKIVTSGIFGIPSSGSAIYSSYSYFLPSKYTVVLSRDKNFYIVSGNSSLTPEEPELPVNSMSLFTFEMPAYTVNANTVKTSSINHQRYTMDDIRKIEERVDNLEYTTRLSLLEQEAKSIKILNGTEEKPKTSILVDSFVTHEVGDTLNSDYNICIDSDKNLLRPPFESKFIDLVNSGSSNITFSKNSTINGQNYPPNVAYLNYTLLPIIDQRVSNGSFDINPFSSSVWVGSITSSPNSITTFDLSTTPYIVSNVNGNNDTFENMKASPLNYNLGGFGTKWNFWQTNWQGYHSLTQDIKSYYGRLTDYIKSQVPKIPKRMFGSKTLNTDLVTYIPSKSVSFRIQGMKPDTIVYPVFDGIRVDSFITNSLGTTMSALKTDSVTGSLEIVFNIPEKTFKSGQKYFIISDDPNGDKSLSTTYAEIKLINSAITPESSDYLNLFGNNTIETKSDDMIDYRSVIAQTFFVDERQYPRGIFVKRIDIFFKTKDTQYPVTLEIRPMKNGYPVVGPGSFSYPNASLTKLPNQINVSTSIGTSSMGTAFEFDAPVHILPGEHALVLSTNSNLYSVHSADYGSNSTVSGARISPVPYVGRLMTTNNSKTWTVYDNTDIAFMVNRCNFVTSGSVSFKDPTISGALPYLYSYGNVNIAYSDLNSNQLDCSIRTISQNELDSSIFDAETLSINPNSNIEFDKLKHFRYNGSSFNLDIGLTSDGVISPILDLDSLKFIAIKNLIRAYGSGFADLSTNRYKNELRPTSYVHEEYANARYITKIVELDPEMETKDCHVFFKLNKPMGTDVKVYIKRQYINTDININDIEYEELNNIGTVVTFTKSNEYVDVHYNIPDGKKDNIISRYNIKIVMFGNIDYTNSVPTIKDLKVITTP